jgi:hypothetical protein
MTFLQAAQRRLPHSLHYVPPNSYPRRSICASKVTSEFHENNTSQHHLLQHRTHDKPISRSYAHQFSTSI